MDYQTFSVHMFLHLNKTIHRNVNYQTVDQYEFVICRMLSLLGGQKEKLYVFSCAGNFILAVCGTFGSELTVCGTLLLGASVII